MKLVVNLHKNYAIPLKTLENMFSPRLNPIRLRPNSGKSGLKV